jgi:hypothetical protein
MKPTKFDFTAEEWKVIQKYRTPEQVQNFLRSLAYNREKGGKTCISFRGVIQKGKAHCLEGAIAAAVILEQHGYPPIFVSIESQDYLDHVLFLYKKNGKYGSVARSRDIGLHGRKPAFRTVRDLVMSYFDAYVDKTGRLIGYGVADLNDLGNYDWRLSKRNVWKVEHHLQNIPHKPIHGSEARYQKDLRLYLKFHEQYPDRSPDYFANKHLWL